MAEPADSKLDLIVGKLVERLGLQIYRYPWAYIAFGITFALTLSMGWYKFQCESNPLNLVCNNYSYNLFCLVTNVHVCILAQFLCYFFCCVSNLHKNGDVLLGIVLQ